MNLQFYNIYEQFFALNKSVLIIIEVIKCLMNFYKI